MRKIFKSIDDRFSEIGFVKIYDNKYVVSYERRNEAYGYTQVLDIIHKASGRHAVISYDKDLLDTEGIGNTGVSLTYHEMKLALKKMRKKHWTTKLPSKYEDMRR